MGKKLYLILATVFTAITFIGIASVLAHTRNAGAAIIPALIALICIRLYQRSK